MPRRSYEEHRAGKRRGSFIESETDAESLASFTTFQSSSSYRPLPSPIHAHPSRLTVPVRQRTMSSSSQPSSPSPQLSQRSFSPSTSALYPTRSGENEAASSRLRREARAKRREERERKSTLRGDRYDSPLRRVVRWCAKNEWKGKLWILVLALSLVVRLGLNAMRTDRFETSALRELLVGALARIPHLNSIHPTPSRYLDLLDQGLRTFGDVGMDTAMWFYAVRGWTDTEAKAAGRSWRTQTIAISTAILTPCFLLPFSASSLYPQWTLAGTVSFFRYICDPGTKLDGTVFWLLALLDPRLAFYVPAVVTHLIFRSLSGSTWLSYVWAWNSVYVPQSIQQIAPRWFEFHASYASLWPSFDLSQVDCANNGPNIWCASDVVVHWARWMPSRAFYVLSSLSTALALLPSIVILSYASWTAGPGDRKTSPASVKLLPTALFTSTLGLLLFLPSSKPTDYVTALVPLTLMTCMRGGKDDIGDDDDGWQWNVLVHNTVAFISLPTWKQSGLTIPAFVLVGLWNWVIGLRPLKLSNLTFRNNTLAVYAGIALVCIGEHIYPYPDRFPSVWAVLRCLISFAVLFPAWIWGLSKLYLQAWALVGLRPGTTPGPIPISGPRAAGPGGVGEPTTIEPIKTKSKDD